MGAGEHMQKMVANGRWYPTMVTLIIAAMLSVWSLYALSGAGLIHKLPFVRLALVTITAVYLLRAVAFPVLTTYIPGNTTTFWYWSSAICFVFGIVHLIGLCQVWSQL